MARLRKRPVCTWSASAPQRRISPCPRRATGTRARPWRCRWRQPQPGFPSRPAPETSAGLLTWQQTAAQAHPPETAAGRSLQWLRTGISNCLLFPRELAVATVQRDGPAGHIVPGDVAARAGRRLFDAVARGRRSVLGDGSGMGDGQDQPESKTCQAHKYFLRVVKEVKKRTSLLRCPAYLDCEWSSVAMAICREQDVEDHRDAPISLIACGNECAAGMK